MTQQLVRRIASLTTEVTVPVAAVTDRSMRDRLKAATRKCLVHASLHPDLNAPIEFRYE